jgi:hypothetical protein
VVTGRSPAEVALAAALEAWEEALRYNPDTTNKRLAMLLGELDSEPVGRGTHRGGGG